MRSIKKLLAIVLSIGIMGSASGCGLIVKTPEGIASTVVAKINDEKITRGEFDKKFEGYLNTMELYYGEDYVKDLKKDEKQLKSLKSNYLDNLVSEALLMQKAKAANLLDDKTLNEEVEKKYKEAVEYYKGEEELKKDLDKAKITVEEYKEDLKNEVIITKFQEYVVKDVTVSDEEAKEYWEPNKYKYTEKPSKMNISHILVKTQAEAKELKEKIEAGSNFEDLAKEHSIDNGSKDKGGLLGDIDYANNNLIKEFFLNAVTVPVGKIGTPFETQYGWHIVKMNSKEEYPLKSFESVKEDIKKELLSTKKSEKFNEEFSKWEDEAKIKTYPDKL